jgi:hypothetical protein
MAGLWYNKRMRDKPPAVALLTVLATALSGALSGCTLLMGSGFTLQFGPGIIFGLATMLLFGWLYNLHIARALLWLAASTFSWFVAIKVFFMSEEYGHVYVNAGVIGGLLLMVAFWLIVKKASLTKKVAVPLVGGVLGYAISMILGGSLDPSLDVISLMVAFAVWQVGVGLILVLDKLHAPIPAA